MSEYKAACIKSGLDFFSNEREEVDKCLALCRTCPRKRDCLDDVLAQGIRVDDGIYGETTPLMRFWARNGLYTLGDPILDEKGEPLFEYWMHPRSSALPAGGFHLQECSSCGEEFTQPRMYKRGSGGYALRCIPCRVPTKSRQRCIRYLRAIERPCVKCKENFSQSGRATAVSQYCSHKCYKWVHDGLKCYTNPARVEQSVALLKIEEHRREQVDKFIELVLQQDLTEAYAENARKIKEANDAQAQIAS